MVNFKLPSTTNEMISISTLQNFRYLVIVFHLRRPMAFLSLNLYDTPGLSPHINVSFRGPGDFPVSYSNRIPRGTLKIVIQEVLWSIRGSSSAFRSFYPSGHLAVPSHFLGLACAPIVETRFLELAMSLLDFSP